MATNDIRLYTRLIIRKDGEYLVAVQIETKKLVWSKSPWDAWWTRTKWQAVRVADRINGEIFLFNPVLGQIKQL